MESLDSTLAFSVRYLLYHQNQLLENLFCFLSSERAVLPALPFVALDLITRRCSRWDLSISEHFATEALELLGDAPEILYDLGFIYTLKESQWRPVFTGISGEESGLASRAREMVEASLARPDFEKSPAGRALLPVSLHRELFLYAGPARCFKCGNRFSKIPPIDGAEYLAAEYLGTRIMRNRPADTRFPCAELSETASTY
jgi:hypothetical protein